MHLSYLKTMIMLPPPLGNMTSIYSFISTSIKLITTKLNRKRPACTNLTLQVQMASLQPGHVTSIYGFMSIFISSIATKLGSMTDLRALNLPGR